MSEATQAHASVKRRGLSALAVRRGVGTFVLALVTLVLGLTALSRLQVDLLPSITYPRINVRVEVPGVAPDVAVEEITRPLEEALSATEGVVQVYSQTREGQVSVNLYFRAGEDVDQALTDATVTVNRARDQLPANAQQLRISKIDPAQLPIIEFALTSRAVRPEALRVFADEELARELVVVPGVASVDVTGGVREEIQVLVDFERLQATGLSIAEVNAALGAQNVDVAAGRLEGRAREALVRTVGRFRDAKDIENVSFQVTLPQGPASASASSLATSDGALSAGPAPPTVSGPAGTSVAPERRTVFLRDFARVIDGTEDQRVFVSLNGAPAVKVSLLKQPEANTVEVVDAVRAKVEELKGAKRLPEGTELTATLDESAFIRSALRDVAVSGVLGAGLASLVMLIFIGSLRQTFIVVFAIPLGSLLAVALLSASGAGLNVFTLGGLAIGIGAVDSTIVVLENIVRAVEARAGRSSGAPGTSAGVVASADPLNSDAIAALSEEKSVELESALVASTTTNLIAVAPFLIIGGFASLLFKELIWTVLFTVAAALVVSLTVVPALASRLLAFPRSSGLARWRPMRWFAAHVASLTEAYGRLLRWSLDHHKRVLVSVACALSAIAAVSVPALSTEILPRVGTGQARLIAQFPPGMPLSTSREIMGRVEAIVRARPEVRYVFTTTGGFLFGSSTSENPLRGSMTITLSAGTDTERFVADVNAALAGLNLVDVRLRLAPEQIRGLITSNSPVRAEVDVILAGDEPQKLKLAGEQVLQALDARARRARFRPDADPAQPEVQIRRIPERAALLGLSDEEIGVTAQTALEGAIATRLQRGERLVDVRVRVEKEELRSIGQLNALPLFAGPIGTSPVRLADVARLEEGRSPAEIQRINQREVFIIAGDLNEGESLGDAFEETDAILERVALPPGVVRLSSANAQSSRELQEALVTLSALAVFFVFAVMALQYDSVVDPSVILFTVPMALVGGVLGLAVTGTAFGATALLGAVLLVGVIVGNGIILVERANQLREERRDGLLGRREAIARAAPERLRPILITTLLATVGLLPLALGIGEGTDLLRPLALVVLFGLALGTLLTLFIVPCLYVLLHDVTGAVARRARAIVLRH